MYQQLVAFLAAFLHPISLVVLFVTLAAQENQGYVASVCHPSVVLFYLSTRYESEKVDDIAESYHRKNILIRC